MRITFENILNEDRGPKQKRYVDMIVAEIKKYYENRYEGTHWVNATHGLSLEQIQKYRGYVNEVKTLSEKLKGYNSYFENIGNQTLQGMREKVEEYRELTEKYKNALHYVAHLNNIFSRSEAGKPNFLENYAIPVDVLLDAWEQFFHDVYTPGKIDYHKSNSGVDLEYGLPEGDYTSPKYYKSIYGDKKYMTFKDSNTGEIILGINVDWAWRETGGSFDKLYYKRYTSESDMFKDLKMLEKEKFKEELKSASFYAEPNEIDEIVSHLDKQPLSYYEDEAIDGHTTITYIISEYADHFANYDRNFNVPYAQLENFAHYYITYKEIISQFK